MGWPRRTNRKSGETKMDDYWLFVWIVYAFFEVLIQFALSFLCFDCFFCSKIESVNEKWEQNHRFFHRFVLIGACSAVLFLSQFCRKEKKPSFLSDQNRSVKKVGFVRFFFLFFLFVLSICRRFVVLFIGTSRRETFRIVLRKTDRKNGERWCRFVCCLFWFDFRFLVLFLSFHQCCIFKDRFSERKTENKIIAFFHRFVFSWLESVLFLSQFCPKGKKPSSLLEQTNLWKKWDLFVLFFFFFLSSMFQRFVVLFSGHQDEKPSEWGEKQLGKRDETKIDLFDDLHCLFMHWYFDSVCVVVSVFRLFSVQRFFLCKDRISERKIRTKSSLFSQICLIPSAFGFVSFSVLSERKKTVVALDQTNLWWKCGFCLVFDFFFFFFSSYSSKVCGLVHLDIKTRNLPNCDVEKNSSEKRRNKDGWLLIICLNC